MLVTVSVTVVLIVVVCVSVVCDVLLLVVDVSE